MSGGSAAPGVIHFYHSPGSCSRVIMIALEEIGIPYELRLIAFMAGEQRAPEYLALNPAGKVPTIVADGKTVTQNMAIQCYLAWAFPATKLLPFGVDALANARIMGHLAWFSSDLHQLVTRIRMPRLISDVSAETVKSIAHAAMARQLEPLERRLREENWFLDTGWSTLDAYLFWVWSRIIDVGFDTEPFPAIAAHSDRMMRRESVVRALAMEKDAQSELDSRGLTIQTG